MRPALVFLALLATAVPLVAQATTPVLIPTFYRGPGQFGSHWSAAVGIVNGSTVPLEGHGVVFSVPCPIPEGCLSGSIPPKEYGQIAEPVSSTGLLLHLPADQADAIEFQSAFGDVEHLYQLPIVRERDFRSTPFSLTVPVLGPFRSTVRIYSPDPLRDQQVLVHLRRPDHPFGDPVHTMTITLEVDDPHSVPIRPAFVQISGADLPDIGAGSVRMTFEPVPRLDGRIPRIWAWATATDNRHNDVWVIWPQ